jgi:homoserine kinase
MMSFRLRLPATSANLGPGFDALGLAMSLHLDIEAAASSEFHIDATGRNADLCAQLDRNLILDTYRAVLVAAHVPVLPLHLTLHNEIPLGMGCGSSAAALLAGVLLANRFGNLGWSNGQILDETCRREGHPDNVAACWLGGMTASAMTATGVIASTCGENLDWRLLIALPPTSLATEKARALLPAAYSRADAVANIQSTALLVGAFALNRPELLAAAMSDRIHQPYRMEACPLLARLLPLSGTPGIYGVALSGAGPSVLLIADPANPLEPLRARIRELAGSPSLEVLEANIAAGALDCSRQTGV